MTLLLPDGYPELAGLPVSAGAGVDVGAALRIGIINIMPRAETYERNLLLPLAHSALPVAPVWIRLASHSYGSSDARHIDRHYLTFDRAIEAGPLDGLIVTGAPVEELPFSAIHYWPELSEILTHS